MTNQRNLVALLAVIMLQACSFTPRQAMKPKTDLGLVKTLSSMSELNGLWEGADLIIFDIDHTILEAQQVSCHSNWFYDQYEEAVKNGISEQSALDALLPAWELSQKDCLVKPVEPVTIEIIQAMQAANKKVLALTSRGKNVYHETVEQLSSLGIDFSASAPLGEYSGQALGAGVGAFHGVIFTSDYVSKGKVLQSYLAQAGFRPKKILFIDDGLRNLTSVVEDMAKQGIETQAFYYPRVKRTLPFWDRVQAKLVWEQKYGPIIFR